MTVTGLFFFVCKEILYIKNEKNKEYRIKNPHALRIHHRTVYVNF